MTNGHTDGQRHSHYPHCFLKKCGDKKWLKLCISNKWYLDIVLCSTHMGKLL